MIDFGETYTALESSVDLTWLLHLLPVETGLTCVIKHSWIHAWWQTILHSVGLVFSQDLAQDTSALAQQTLCQTTLCCGLPVPERMLKAALASTHRRSVTSFHPAAMNKPCEATAKFPIRSCHLKSAGLASGHLHEHYKYLSRANSQGFFWSS